MKRRTFLAGLVTTAAGLVLPHEPKRIYSFPSLTYLGRPKATLDGFEIVNNGRIVRAFGVVNRRGQYPKAITVDKLVVDLPPHPGGFYEELENLLLLGAA